MVSEYPQIQMINRIDLYGLMTDMLVLEPNVYRRVDKHYSRAVNGIFSHRTPLFIFQIYSASDHYSIATKERKSMNDNWSSVYRLRIPKSGFTS
jgi:hypothetical protein